MSKSIKLPHNGQQVTVYTSVEEINAHINSNDVYQINKEQIVDIKYSSFYCMIDLIEEGTNIRKDKTPQQVGVPHEETGEISKEGQKFLSLMSSLKNGGQLVAIKIDKNRVILDGYMRKMAIARNGRDILLVELDREEEEYNTEGSDTELVGVDKEDSINGRELDRMIKQNNFNTTIEMSRNDRLLIIDKNNSLSVDKRKSAGTMADLLNISTKAYWDLQKIDQSNEDIMSLVNSNNLSITKKLTDKNLIHLSKFLKANKEEIDNDETGEIKNKFIDLVKGGATEAQLVEEIKLFKLFRLDGERKELMLKREELNSKKFGIEDIIVNTSKVKEELIKLIDKRDTADKAKMDGKNGVLSLKPEEKRLLELLSEICGIGKLSGEERRKAQINSLDKQINGEGEKKSKYEGLQEKIINQQDKTSAYDKDGVLTEVINIED